MSLIHLKKNSELCELLITKLKTQTHKNFEIYEYTIRRPVQQGGVRVLFIFLKTRNDNDLP